MAESIFQCGPCTYNYISKVAYKWCTVCQEGFCKDCEKMHKATKISRDHKLIGIKDYRKLSSISVQQICEEHEKIFDSYCKLHDVPLCLSCALTLHKSCGDIILLEDAAKNAKSSTALIDLQETISVGLKNIHAIIQNTNPEFLIKDEKRIKGEIRELRTKIDEYLDEMEQNLILELHSKLASCKSKQSEVFKMMKESEKTMKDLEDQTNEMRNLASDLHIFLGTRRINRKVHECLKSTLKRNVIEKYNVNVEIDPVFRSLMTDVKTFGKINVEETKTPIEFTQAKVAQAQIHLHPVTKSISEIEVNLKKTFTIKKESGGLRFTGCVILPDGHVLIADYRGEKQLMQYNQNGIHVRDIPVYSEPYDITVIDSDRVAVSYGGSFYIEILNIQNTTVVKKVDLGNTTKGLSYQGGKLYVIVYGRGIAVIDVSGKIVNTINITFDSVWYVTTTTDRIYYSDYVANTVTCCDMSGKQIWKFKNDSVVMPYGLTVDYNQNVIVVGYGSKNIAIISRDGQTSKILLTGSDGLDGPRAIDLNKDTGDIFVCSHGNTKAFLFKISEFK